MPTNHVVARVGFTLSWPLALWDFCNIFKPNTGEDQKKSYLSTGPQASGGFRGGGCIPPTSLKVTILAEKSASVSNNSAPFRDASPPTPISAEKSLSILVKTFFFFFWRPPEHGRKKRLNFRLRPKNHSQFWWRHPNFWGFVLQIPPHQNFLDPPLPLALCIMLNPSLVIALHS